MIRIAAALAASLVMASSAWAQTGQVGQTGFLPNGTLTVQAYPTQLSHCAPGWMLVEVASAYRPIVHKCAAVGDLRDPE